MGSPKIIISFEFPEANSVNWKITVETYLDEGTIKHLPTLCKAAKTIHESMLHIKGIEASS